MCSTVQEQITTCGQNAIVKIGERTNIHPQKLDFSRWYTIANDRLLHEMMPVPPTSCNLASAKFEVATSNHYS